MGSKVSKLQKDEKSTWSKPHELLYNNNLRQEQIALLENFGKNLKICFLTTKSFPQYQQWFVTDGKLIMEFGKEDLTDLGQLTLPSELTNHLKSDLLKTIQISIQFLFNKKLKN